LEAVIYGGPYAVGTGALLSQTAINANIAGATPGPFGATATFYVSSPASPNTELLDVDLSPAPTPEPATWLSLALGLGGVALLKRGRDLIEKSSR
jgi:hypothetical protein